MILAVQLRNTILSVFYSLVPGFKGPALKPGTPILKKDTRPGGHIESSTQEIHNFLLDPVSALQPAGTLKVLLPHTLPPAAPFVLYRLKRSGFSSCRVTVMANGLLVEATR
jgi:hypothetical protein